MKHLVTLLAIVLLVGCKSHRPLATTVNTLDSTHVLKTVRLRDTVINLPFYKADVSVAAKDLTSTPVTRANGRASVSIWKSNDSIHATAICDSLELQLQLKDSLISTYRLLATDKSVTLPPVKVKYTPWYMKTLACIGGIWLLVFGIRSAIKFYKP